MKITPTEFQAIALGWIGVITIIALAALNAYGKITEAIKDLKARSDRHGDKISELQILTPPPTAPQSAPAPAADVTINNNAPDTTDTGSETPQ